MIDERIDGAVRGSLAGTGTVRGTLSLAPGAGMTYTLTQDPADPMTLVLTSSAGDEQRVTIPALTAQSDGQGHVRLTYGGVTNG